MLKEWESVTPSTARANRGKVHHTVYLAGNIYFRLRLRELTSKLMVRVVRVDGNYCNHKIGDFFEVENDVIRIPPGKHVCIWSMSSLLPFLSARQRSTEGSADWLFGVEYIHCPDPDGKVVWKIESKSLK